MVGAACRGCPTFARSRPGGSGAGGEAWAPAALMADGVGAIWAGAGGVWEFVSEGVGAAD